MYNFAQIRYWVDDLPKMGITAFSLDDVIRQFPEKPPDQVKNALARLVSAEKIRSVWKGFYAIVLPDYGRNGIVPPTVYIDHLMKYLGKNYYVALLSAAALDGAAHQKPQTLTFISDSLLHPKEKGGVRLEPVYKNRLPLRYVTQKNVKSGTINVSLPELTAVDLLLYPQKSGGLNNIATVLDELSEHLDFDRCEDEFFGAVPTAAIQRLGYLFDEVLGKPKLASRLLAYCHDAGQNFRKVPLALPASSYSAGALNDTWRLIVNCEVEADL
jgi:predicted transcriptional regulator of viral defense system